MHVTSLNNVNILLIKRIHPFYNQSGSRFCNIFHMLTSLFRHQRNRRHLFRSLSSLIGILALTALLTLCRHTRTVHDPILEKRILSLDSKAAADAADSLDKSVERNIALIAFCQGRVAYEEGDYRHATTELKLAESIIDSTEYSPLRFGIEHYLFYLNYYYGDSKTALRYANATRDIANKLQDSTLLCTAINCHAAALLEFNRRTEAIDTMLRVLDYASILPARQKARMYNNIGYMFQDSDINVSRKYYELSLSEYPTNTAMANIAAIHAREGNLEAADSLWSRSLASASSYPLRLHILTDIYNTQCELGDFRRACNTADSLISLKIRMETQRTEHDVTGEQLRFDNQLQHEHTRQRIRSLIFVIVIVILLAVLTWLFHFYRRSRIEKELAKERIMARALQTRIETLQQEIDETKETNSMQHDEIIRLRELTEEIGKLNSRLQSLKDRQAAVYANGRKRYEEVAEGNSIIKWSKRDIDDCVEYFELVDTSYMASLDTLYSGLTSKNKLFMILSHIGKSDSEIQQIFGVGPNAIRTLRSRIKAKLS